MRGVHDCRWEPAMETEVLHKGLWRKSPQWFMLNRRHAQVRAAPPPSERNATLSYSRFEPDISSFHINHQFIIRLSYAGGGIRYSGGSYLQT